MTLAMIGTLLVLSAAPAWAISISPTTIDFGKVRVGVTKEIDVNVTLSSGYRIGAISTSNFHVVLPDFGTCAPDLVGPTSCFVQYFGHPSNVGVVTGLFSVSECIALTGTGCQFVQSTWTIEGVANDAPVCDDTSITIKPNTSAHFNLPCTDTDPITFAGITSPQHGSVTLLISTGAVIYTPNPGYTGPDSFTYQADDGIAYPASNIATANIDVRNPAPHPSPTPTPTFTLNLSKAVGGRVTSDPAGINCGTDCTGNFDEGSQVTLTAKAHAGWEFKRWRYRCKGQGKVCTIEVTSNFRAMAVFVRPPIVRGDRNRGL